MTERERGREWGREANSATRWQHKYLAVIKQSDIWARRRSVLTMRRIPWNSQLQQDAAGGGGERKREEQESGMESSFSYILFSCAFTPHLPHSLLCRINILFLLQTLFFYIFVLAACLIIVWQPPALLPLLLLLCCCCRQAGCLLATAAAQPHTQNWVATPTGNGNVVRHWQWQWQCGTEAGAALPVDCPLDADAC